MSYQFKIGKNGEIPIPDDICNELDFNVGDILFCEAIADSSAISISKHCDQTLSDDEISESGNLTRVIPYDSGQ
ncbi:hypothetical protein [Rheinheimera soli]|uniref:hypothetical protein n=1 Tax=Rheinheimera soli TaxID=443616 RepID=UPI001E5343F2|nr:hypothetical protein [Rheinheimera soli]